MSQVKTELHKVLAELFAHGTIKIYVLVYHKTVWASHQWYIKAPIILELRVFISGQVVISASSSASEHVVASKLLCC